MDTTRLLVFEVEEQRYGLYLAAIDRVVRAVEITPLPKAPEIVLGVLNLQGRLLPVFNLRRRFRLRERDIDPDDHFIIARTAHRSVALPADAVLGLVELPHEQIVASQRILPGLEYLDGIVKLQDGLILIHNLDQFLSLDEATNLDRAMTASRPMGPHESNFR